MKRVFTAFWITIFSILTISGSIVGFAVEESGEIITINPPALDPVSETLNITGEIENDVGRIPLILWIKRDNVTIDAQQIKSDLSVDGKSSFTFAPIKFDRNTTSGLYKITVSADYLNSVKTLDYDYIGVDKRFESNKAIVGAKNSIESMQNVITDFYDVFSIDLFVYENLSDTATEALAKLLMKDDYSCPENYTDEGNADIISENIGKFVSNYNKYMIIAQAVNIEDEDSLKLWLDSYASGAGFYDDVPETDYNEEVIAKEYFDDLDKTTAFIKRVNNIALKAEDFASLKDEILRASLLSFIETSNYVKTKQIAEAFPELFDIFTSKFKSLSGYEESVVYKSVTGTYWNTIEEFCLAVKEAIEDLNSGDSGNRGSGGSKGGSSGGGSYGKPVDVSKEAVEDKTRQNAFSDLQGYEWAEAAVLELSEKGIVSGREEGKFVPDGNVTRAEFIKMLSLAVGVEPNETFLGIFNDVKESDWFWFYVEAANQAGIASGFDGEFMPDEDISREDMAVLLFRACKFDLPENEEEIFNDTNLISDYAKGAVFALYEKGIILGNGSGDFNPKGNALRAEAAQIIYRMLEMK